ncbi:hypothetical protein DUI87_10016 [Hirundo rustica rustica]|uniref:Cysteine-rich PDZ-binding protein n=1 Tax=Hirundo rustica rustica TaxID=333673 RepID=A0A3M0KGW7_HIRRU|nr:hypothetical protein DUI87_10016 [Hirundo rustica rustica]
MVCDKCEYGGEKKLGTVITPDTWKDGARNTTESGGRKLNENKALTSKKARFDPYGKNKFAICRICKSSVHQPGSHYCQGCAYKKDWFGLFVIRVPKKSLKDQAYFVYEVVSAQIWSEPEAVTDLLYLKIDPCLDNEILVTLIAVLSSGYVKHKFRDSPNWHISQPSLEIVDRCLFDLKITVCGVPSDLLYDLVL